MDLRALASDLMTTREVIGEPVERNGVTVVPVVAIRGGGGGGDDGGGDGRRPAGGGGFGVVARPVGAYVLQGGQVRWEPALDLTRLAIGAQVTAIVLALILRSILRRARR